MLLVVMKKQFDVQKNVMHNINHFLIYIAIVAAKQKY